MESYICSIRCRWEELKYKRVCRSGRRAQHKALLCMQIMKPSFIIGLLRSHRPIHRATNNVMRCIKVIKHNKSRLMSFPAHQRCLLGLHKQTTLMPQFRSHVCEFLMTRAELPVRAVNNIIYMHVCSHFNLKSIIAHDAGHFDGLDTFGIS